MARDPVTTTLVMRALLPPVAVLLVKAAPALEPRADLVALRARLHRLGVVAGATLALCIRSEPRCNNWSLRVGRGGKSEDEAERGQCQGPLDGASPHAVRPRTMRTIQINKHAPMNPAIS